MFAQESGMDLQKEREAFEKECRLLCYKGNMVMSNLGSFYNNEQTNWMWQMWLSAKAQAVPEGFVLVEKKILLEGVNKIEQLFEDDPLLALGELLPIQQGLKAMIEAQEPAND